MHDSFAAVKRDTLYDFSTKYYAAVEIFKTAVWVACNLNYKRTKINGVSSAGLFEFSWYFLETSIESIENKYVLDRRNICSCVRLNFKIIF